jgi:hypothetical protein
MSDAAPDELASAALALARHFAAGATLWCVSPPWPAHAHHVAVEFVHPVIVGKRALPAVALDGTAASSTLRMLAKPGDVVLVMSASADPASAGLLARAEAWGLTRLWFGVGPRPPTTRAEHVVWLDDELNAELAARCGDVVVLYHVLWELTHVAFEHPGLLAPVSRCAEEVCVTCSDQALVGEVRSVRDGREAEVVVAGRREHVDVTLVEPVAPGDLVLVHAGVALSSIDEEGR